MSNGRGISFLDSFLQHRKVLTGYVSRIVPANEAEDIVQETFVRIFSKNPENIRAPRALMFTTARNLAIDHLRHGARINTGVNEDVAVSEHACDMPTPEQQAMSREELEFLMLAISELPPKCREVFRLRRVEGLSHKEIGNRLGLSSSAIEQHISKGLAHCAKRMKRVRVSTSPSNKRTNGTNSVSLSEVSNG